MRYVLGPNGGYDGRLHRLIGYLVDARIFRGEILLGIQSAGDLVAAALVSRPDSDAPTEMVTARENCGVRSARMPGADTGPSGMQSAASICRSPAST